MSSWTPNAIANQPSPQSSPTASAPTVHPSFAQGSDAKGTVGVGANSDQQKKIIQGDWNARGLTIGVVTARFNSEVTFRLEEGALNQLKEMDCSEVRAIRVAGAFEVPLAAQKLLDAGCDGVVALGAVIRGETSHYDYVCSSVERGCTELALRTGKPVGFGILTTENDQQAMDRAGGRHGNKGAEAAQVTVEMVNLLRMIEASMKSREQDSSLNSVSGRS